MWSNKCSPKLSSKTKIKILREELLHWTCKRHAIVEPLSIKILGDKATDLAVQLDIKDFNCTKSWITRFLKKHGFSPTLSTDCGPFFSDYREWIELMRSCMSQYRYKNLFHVDEMGMYHDISPEKLPHMVDFGPCKYGENRESRVTLLLCCNASGTEKLPLVICGKSAYTLYTPNFCQYYTNKNAWLTPNIFKAWLTQLNDHMSQSNRKILLLLNRRRLHVSKDLNLSNVKLMFFPTDFPSTLQPLRINIFHYLKMIYRQKHTNRMLQPDFNWTLKDAIEGIVNAWESVPKEFILSSFRRSNFRLDNDRLKISCPEWDRLETGVCFRSYVTFDDNLCVNSSYTARSSRRLGRIRTTGNSATACFTSGDEYVDLGGSESEENTIEELSQDSTGNEMERNLSVVNSYDHVHVATDEQDVDNAADFTSDTRKVATFPVSKDSDELRCNDDHGYLKNDNFTTCSPRPLLETVIVYVEDIVQNAMETVPDVVKLTSVPKSNDVAVGTDDVSDRCRIDEDEEVTSITRKRRRVGAHEAEESNDDSWEPTKKRRMGDPSWSDVYEHSFVFGAPESPPGTNSDPAEEQTALPDTAINSYRKNDDPEPKSIFTISNASSSSAGH